MYIPFNEEGTELFTYDVNSLYPSVMLNSLMPIGHPMYFKGDIRKIEPNAFRFFFCNIIAP
jgi:DNA polymerase type B, organellar and viral